MNRHHEIRTVKDVEYGVSYEGGYGHGMFPEMEGKVKAGDVVILETKGFSTITGVFDINSGLWYFRKSDEDLERERIEFSEALEKKHQDVLEANRDDWQTRTALLPYWINRRIEKFQESPLFAADGWGYELCVAELAVFYVNSGGEDTEDIMNYGRENGTSGNQHECAKALANMHRKGEDLYGTISALSPLTGDAYYEKG